MREEAKRITKRLEQMQQKPSTGNAASSGTQSPARPVEVSPSEVAVGDAPPRMTDSPEPLDPAQGRAARTRSVSIPIGLEGLGGSWSMEGERPPRPVSPVEKTRSKLASSPRSLTSTTVASRPSTSGET